ncbi:MAG TPA: hypothetical protein VFS43_43940 [Polyangiaceae bacterium]|nr:hypothetical protein [Polyangiaceae bacterium]
MNESLTEPRPSLRDVALGALGCATFGAAAALGHGPRAVGLGALSAPALFVGGALLSAPPLYLLLALGGGRATAADVADALGASLHKITTVLWGLAAPAAYFSVTLRTNKSLALLVAAAAVVGGAAVVSTAERLSRGESKSGARLMTGVWCAVALLLGLRLVSSLGRANGLWG